MPRVINKADARKLDIVGKVRSESGERLYKPAKTETAIPLPTPEKSDTAKAMEMIADAIRQNQSAVQVIAQTHSAKMETMLKMQEVPKVIEKQEPPEEWNFEVVRDRAGKIERIRATKESS